MTTGPLDGVLVADFSRVLAAPYLTMLLGDLGADVVKVERPGTGDDTRSWGPPWAGDEATYFLSVNRNKRSVQLDLSRPEDRASARELARRSDVVIENFRPGTMARYGLDERTLRTDAPGLVYCSISGFGTGPGASLPGYDLLVQALGGLMSVTGAAAGHPNKVGVALVDVLCGLHAGLGVLAALRHRDRTGRGQLVEVDLLSTLLSSMVNQAGAHAMTGAVPGILGNRHPSIAPYEVFPAADRPIALAVGTDRQFRSLAGALDLGDLADDPRFATNSARVAHVDELAGLLAPRLAARTADDWFDTLTARGIPCGPVNDLAEAFRLAARLGLGPTVPVGDRELVADPIRLGTTPVTYRRPPPRLGEHTEEIGRWLAPHGEETCR
ncbi:carnitine dehydratase [Pseudonocardia sp. EC080610-09]|uniref:CaiB/BaiF CoA transferase family protein n=1 Tax=unclassified Pseudonocardia TaxID=2619320 RepID=UPI0006CAFEBD|nr:MULTISPECIES: CoA transferase [unclassified Pseudonocardia]ALE74345.1 carnitine dehydratase [Pseudonocardia sp. EC080625-04]ALL77753.1 carnitine dehydratase [Pseudonocardia sp. EC080610-09]ALL80668.1 carnitine dehydratase [Pseudonocardia sp. EC080619-01]